MQDLRRRFDHVAVALLTAVVPALLLAFGVVRHMFNHFFARAPYLLDSGMLSGLTYHDGLLLAMPKIACDYADLYYDVYISPLTSLFSALSYIVPTGRLEWFAIVEGSIYLPIGLVVYVVASRLDPGSALRRLPITVIAALVFSFNGFVLWMVGYPHMEAAMPGLTCLVLAAVVTGRPRAAWVCLALAASVRQDGGIQVAMALAPLLWLDRRGVAMWPTRRRLIAMVAVALAISVLGMLSQRVLFHPFPRLTQAYLGDPLYAHLSVALLAQRARVFVVENQLIYYPLLATFLIAVVRRDARYLLGWVSVVPWFAFSFCAVEEPKASFFAYGAGPFMVGMFWVYLYGAHLAPPARRMRAGVVEAMFALVCLTSTYGAYRAEPVWVTKAIRDMAIARRTDRAAVHGFVDAIHVHRASFGKLRVDGAVAALALEHLAPDEVWRPEMTGVDTIAFHRAPSGRTILPGLLANQLDVCTQVRETGIFVCSHDRLPAGTLDRVPIDVLPATFFFAAPVPGSAVKIEDRGVVLRTADTYEGWLGSLPRGTYVWTIAVATDEPVILAGPVLVRLEVTKQGAAVALGTIARAGELTVRFDVDGGAQPLTYRFASNARTPVIVTSAKLRRVTTDAALVP